MAKRERISEDQLKAITDQELRQAVGYNSSRLSEMRRKAMYYYYGRAEGDLSPPEIEGRSSVVSTDVADTIEWMLPALLKIFTAGDNVVEFAPQREEDEEAAKQATDYINYVFYRQNPGFQVMYTWMKDALLQKNGLLKVYWDKKTVEEREERTGQTLIDLQQLLTEEGVTLLEQKPREMTPEEQMMMPPGVIPVLYDVALKREKDVSQVRVENVPPEEFLISRRAKSLTDTPFCAHRVARTLSDLRAKGYKNVEELTSDDNAQQLNAERVERNSWDDDMPYLTATEGYAGERTQRVVWVTECYLRCDYDGDGIAEWRKVTRCGNTLLDNEECDGPPFVSITPIPLPHRFFGLSIADLAMPIQQQKTAVWRAILDNLYLQVNGRYYAQEGQVNLDDLLTSRPGGVVRIKSPGAVGRLDQGVADSGQAYKMLEYLEVQKENRTGFTRYSQGNDANSLNKTATGINIITNRADERIELIARVFAETGVTDLFKLILKLITQHQDRVATVRINGQWLQIDPREWKNQFDLTINVGLGTGNKDQIVGHLMQLLGIQKEALAIGLADPKNLFNSAKKLAENLGFKQPELFFKDPSAPPDPNEPPKPPPPPDPKLVEAQNKAKADEARLQLEMMKIQGEQTLQRERLEAEITLKREEMILKYRTQLDMAQFAALNQQSEAVVDGPGEGSAAGAGSGPPVGGPPIPGGGGYPPIPPDGGMGNQPGAGF